MGRIRAGISFLAHGGPNLIYYMGLYWRGLSHLLLSSPALLLRCNGGSGGVSTCSCCSLLLQAELQYNCVVLWSVLRGCCFLILLVARGMYIVFSCKAKLYSWWLCLLYHPRIHAYMLRIAEESAESSAWNSHSDSLNRVLGCSCLLLLHFICDDMCMWALGTSPAYIKKSNHLQVTVLILLKRCILQGFIDSWDFVVCAGFVYVTSIPGSFLTELLDRPDKVAGDFYSKCSRCGPCGSVSGLPQSRLTWRCSRMSIGTLASPIFCSPTLRMPYSRLSGHGAHVVPWLKPHVKKTKQCQQMSASSISMFSCLHTFVGLVCCVCLRWLQHGRDSGLSWEASLADHCWASCPPGCGTDRSVSTGPAHPLICRLLCSSKYVYAVLRLHSDFHDLFLLDASGRATAAWGDHLAEQQSGLHGRGLRPSAFGPALARCTAGGDALGLRQELLVW